MALPRGTHLLALSPADPHAAVALQEHADVVPAVADGQRHLPARLLHPPNDFRLFLELQKSGTFCFGVTRQQSTESNWTAALKKSRQSAQAKIAANDRPVSTRLRPAGASAVLARSQAARSSSAEAPSRRRSFASSQRRILDWRAIWREVSTWSPVISQNRTPPSVRNYPSLPRGNPTSTVSETPACSESSIAHVPSAHASRSTSSSLQSTLPRGTTSRREAGHVPSPRFPRKRSGPRNPPMIPPNNRGRRTPWCGSRAAFPAKATGAPTPEPRDWPRSGAARCHRPPG